jgi:hypothetical protein
VLIHCTLCEELQLKSTLPRYLCNNRSWPLHQQASQRLTAMKFITNTVSKPVVGKEAEKLTKALKKGGHVANTKALETIARIAKRRAETA